MDTNTATPMTPDVARVRLAQYGERTKTWSTATYDNGTERALHEIALTLRAEADELRARLAELEAPSTDEPADRPARKPAPAEEHREDDDPARCLTPHRFSPRDGWRLVCASCDHHKDAPCHP